MLSWQSNGNGSSTLDFDTKACRFRISVFPNGKKPIIKRYWFYRHARRALERLRRKYGLG